MKIGVITYDYSHLKTEQLVNKYVRDQRIKEIKIFALPFHKKKKREIVFNHRPVMTEGAHIENMARMKKVSFQRWDGTSLISNEVDFFVIGGAGILDTRLLNNKPAINAHPGIIPSTRGLDSFKWAIFNNMPLGVTLHFIDNEIDKGQVLAIEKTPVFKSDTIETLAVRHYQLEIDMLSNIVDIIDKYQNSETKEFPPTLRMDKEKEQVTLNNFENWKKSFFMDGIIKKTISLRDIRAGGNVEIIEPCNLYECELGEGCFVGPFVEIQKGVKIGKRTRIQSHAFICELVTIGDNCFISHGVKFINDKFRNGGVSGDKHMWEETKIGNNVSIGTNSTILPVKICDDVVIGAGSVVSKDIAVAGTYAGNPARKLT